MRSINFFAALVGFATAQDEGESDILDTLSFTYTLWEHADINDRDYSTNLSEILPTDDEWPTKPTYEEVLDICETRPPLNQC